jgi:hypothetical protein
MAKFSMDFSKFKRVSSDGKSTTMKHEDGHSITIAHNSLSPKFRAMLAALPGASATPGQASEARNQGIRLADGGEAKKMEKGQKFNYRQPENPHQKWATEQKTRVPAGELTYQGQEGEHHIFSDRMGNYHKIHSSKITSSSVSPAKEPPKFADGGEVANEKENYGDPFFGHTKPAPTDTPKPTPEPRHPNEPGSDVDKAFTSIREAFMAHGGQAHKGPKVGSTVNELEGKGEEYYVNPKTGHTIKFINGHIAGQPPKGNTEDTKPMAHGGMTPPPQFRNPTNPNDSERQEAEGKKYADGGDVEPVDENSPDAKPASSDTPAATINAISGLIDKIGARQPDAGNAPAAQPQAQPQMNQEMGAPGAAQAPAAAPPPAGMKKVGPQAAAQQPPQQAPQSPVAAGIGAANQLGVESLSQGAQGLGLGAQAQTQAGMIQGQAAQDVAAKRDKVLSTYQNTLNTLIPQTQQFLQELKDYNIDPNHYLGSMDTPSKISTAMGLLTSGFNQGQGLKFINDQINRDVEAQKAELGKRTTLLEGNLKMYGNMAQAVDATRYQLNELYLNKVQAGLAKQVPGAGMSLAALNAKAALAQGTAQWAQQNMDRAQSMASKEALLTGLTHGFVSPQQAAQTIQFSGLIPEKDQDAVGKQLNMANRLNNTLNNSLIAFDNIAHLNTIQNRWGQPIQSGSQIDAMKTEAMAQLSAALQEGGSTAGERANIEKIFTGILDNPDTYRMKRASLERTIRSANTFDKLDAYGLNPLSHSNQPSMAAQPMSAPAAGGVRFKRTQ